MDDPLLMRCLQRVRNLFRQAQRLIDRNRTTRNEIRKRFTLHEFQNQTARLSQYFEIVDRGNVRVIEGGQNFRFAPEPGDAIRIFGKRVWQDFDGDITLELGISGKIHLTHAARPEQRP